MKLSELTRLYRKPMKDSDGNDLENGGELFDNKDFKGNVYKVADTHTIKSAGGEYFVITKSATDKDQHAIESMLVKTRAGEVRIPKGMTSLKSAFKSLLSTTDQVAVKWQASWAEQCKEDIIKWANHAIAEIDRNVAGAKTGKAGSEGYTLK